MDITSGHVLVVDNDPATCSQLQDYLGRHDFQVTALDSGKRVLEMIGREGIDLLLLETGLRGEDGLWLTRAVRETSNMAIVVLSKRDDVSDRVMGLESGADDYLTKPFSPRELVARMRAVLRRRQSEVHCGRPDGVRAYRFESWELNLNLRRLKNCNGQVVGLSNGEFSLLVALLGAPNRILSRDQLLDMSRLHNDDVYSRSVNTQILRLRRKIETDPLNPRFIKTERGAGYFFDAPVSMIH